LYKLQCQNFSGVYDIQESSRKEMKLMTTSAIGFPGQSEILKLEEQ
jgi:hypothetical protein